MPIIPPLILPPVGPVPPPEVAVTDRNTPHWQDSGWALLLAVARPLRLADALRERRLAPEQGRRLLHGVVEAVRPLVLAVTDALIAGHMRLAGWSRAMRDALVPGYFAGAMAVLDDPDPPPADVAAIVVGANRQMGFLARFRGQVATAAEILGPGTRARAEMYAEALWSTSLNVQRAEKVRDGIKLEYNQLGISDHCDDCIAQSLAGWVPIGTLVAPGDRRCMTRCRCWLEFR